MTKRKSLNSLYGLVLCGGQSSRMGKDKGLIKIQQKTWVEIVAEKLFLAGLVTKISLRMGQADTYKNLDLKYEKIYDLDIPYAGPAMGIISASLKYPDIDWLVLSCDMIRITDKVINSLVNLYSRTSGLDFFYYVHEGNPEPLCAIYTARGINAMKDSMNKTQNYSLSKYLMQSSAGKIQADEAISKSLQSFNTPEDINFF